MRLGVGHPGHKDRVHGHVLGDFSAADREWVELLLDAVAAAAPLIAAGDDAGAMNKIALLTRPAQPEPKPSEPKPSEPKPSEPKPSEPKPSGSGETA